MMKKMLKRVLSFVLVLVMVLSLAPQLAAPAFAVDFATGTGNDQLDSNGKPLTCNGKVVLALYFNGTTFPGEPREHGTGDYIRYNLDLEKENSGYFSAAQVLKNVLNNDVDYIIQSYSTGWLGSVSGVSGIFDPNGLDDEHFTQVFNDALAEHEDAMITDVLNAKSAAGQSIGSTNPDDYEIVWYVIKYQYSKSMRYENGEWHVNGLIREKDKYTVLYDGNGATAGSPPDGVIDMSYTAAQNYTVKNNSNGLSHGNNYEFVGWNTKADGSGTFYSPGQKADLTLLGQTSITLYAQWREKTKVTVSWYDGNGNIIHVDTGVAGDEVDYDGVAPTKNPTNTNTFTFNGIWKDKAEGGNAVSLPLTLGSSNIKLYAQFDSTPRTYTVTWVNHTVIETDSGLAHGATTKYDGAIPTRSTTETEGYLFKGWSTTEDGTVQYNLRDEITVNGDMTLYAVFDLVPMRTVTWYNEDGSAVLATQRVLEGGTAAYPNALPSKLGNSFNGWATAANGVAAYAPGASITVSGDMNLYADFEPTKHTVTWVNWNDTVLETDYNVPYGTTPEYNGSTPTRPSTAEESYTFVGWNPNVDTVTGDITYKAVFSSAPRAYTVTWNNYDNTLIKRETVNYGVTPNYTGSDPVHPESDIHSYEFIGWTPSVSAVTGDVTYTAKFNEIDKLFDASVTVWVDPTIDTTSGAVTDGDKTYLDSINAPYTNLYLRNVADSSKIYTLSKVDGVYKTSAPHGSYVVISANSSSAAPVIQERIVLPLDTASSDPDSTAADIIFYSVTYEFDGGLVGVNNRIVEYHQRGSDVFVSNYTPSRSLYIFDNWKLDADAASNYLKDQRITVIGSGIIKPHTLTAKWIPAQDSVKVNVTILHHDATENGYNPQYKNGTLNIGLTHREKSSTPGDYYEKTGAAYSVSTNTWYTDANTVISGDGKTCTTTLSNVFSVNGLPSNFEYSANVTMDDYWRIGEPVIVKTENGGNTVYEINVTLQYTPDLFPLQYTVNIDPAMHDSLVPTAVDLKVLSFKDSDGNGIDDWSPISRHVNTTIDEAFTADDRTESGSYSVPVHQAKLGDPLYYYRVAVAGFTMPDGTELSASGGLVDYSSTATGSTATYKYAAGAYTAEVIVEYGAADIGGAPAVFGEKVSGSYVQTGTITVTVYANPYTVTFDPAGGKLNGNDGLTSVPNQFRIPVLGAYVPTREGGYVFDGWQLSGSAAVTGTPITSNVTLIAKWKAPLTVSGEIRIEKEDKNGKDIHADSLPTELIVTLEKHTPSGDNLIAQSKTYTLNASNYTGDHGLLAYSFDPVPQDGSTYRVYVNVINYETAFLNEPTANTVTEPQLEQSASYTGTRVAVDSNSDNAAKVYAHLVFDPDEFNLTWDVDASAIGAAFRPGSLNVLVRYNHSTNDSNPLENWKIIVQHYNESTHVYSPENTPLDANGLATDFYSVWKLDTNGHPYDYALKLHELSNSDKITVSYDPAIAWHNGTKQVTANPSKDNLQITLTPKSYSVSYDLNAGSDPVLGMDDYPVSHTWSHKTIEIPLELSRPGYDFLGWTADVPGYAVEEIDGVRMGTISADTAQNITLTAQWRKQKVVTFKVVNGTWSDDAAADIVCYVSLDGSGNGSVAVPEGMKANYAYGNGSWNDAALNGLTSTAVSSDTPITYTYSYQRLSYPVSYDTDAIGGADSSDDVYHGNYIRIDPTGGIYGGNAAEQDVRIEAAHELAAPTRDGYIFNGWERHYIEDNATYPGWSVTRRFVAKWLRDENGDTIPDYLQKKITFKIVNGTWDGVNSDPIVEFVTPDGSGTADISALIPTGMKARVGFVNEGLWDPALPAGGIVSGTNEVVYTYYHYTTVTYSDYALGGASSQLLILPGSFIRIDPAGGTLDANPAVSVVQVNGAYILDDAVYTNHDFLGWSLSISGGSEYSFTAQWKKDSYTITWENEDGTVLETDPDVEFGTMPVYNGGVPTKPSTAEFDYTFKGWSPAIVAAYENATYTATFDAVRRSYTVTWKNWDGSILDTDTVEYGQTPAFAGTPGRPATAEHSYGFIGWTPTVVAVTGDAEYTATYSETTNKYTVTWVDSDGTTILETDMDVPYGTAPSFDKSGGTAALASAKSDAQYTYTFAGWTPSVSNVTGNAVYRATYSSTVNTYSVKWYKEDGTTLIHEESVAYGTVPTAPAAPVKTNTDEHTYTFSGWKSGAITYIPASIPAVTGDVSYTAQYAETVNTYTVTWINYNGAVLETDLAVPYGSNPAFNKTTPSRAATSHFTYSFNGWWIDEDADGAEDVGETVYGIGDTLPSVTGNVTYKARFLPKQILFTGTVKVHLNNVLITSGMSAEAFLGGAHLYLGNGVQGHATDYYPLSQSATEAHIYSNSNLPNGHYYVYASLDGVSYTQLCEQMLTIENADRDRESHFYSVSYDPAGGIGAPATTFHHKDHAASISTSVPTRAGYVFTGWKVNGGEVKQPGAALTASIDEAYTLTAQWVEAVDIKVNVVLDHTSALGNDSSATKSNVTVELVSRPNDTAPWAEVAGTVLPLSESSHAKHAYASTEAQTTYTANAVTYSGTALKLRSGYLYSLTAVKDGYELQSVTWDSSTKTLTATLKYAPEDFDLSFSVSTDIADSAVYPSAAIIRVLRWNSSTSAWEYIPQHIVGNPGASVVIDPITGKGSGSVTVRKEHGAPAVLDDYRIEVSALYYDGGIHALSGSGNVYSNGFYTATVQPVGTTGHSHDGLDGAYWDGSTQVGTLEAKITIGLYDIVFEENGGSDITDMTDQYKLPDLTADAYKPTRSGGYVFVGWYTNNALTIPAVSGARISTNTTLYAKWIAPWTISGDITVDGYYLFDHDSDSTTPDVETPIPDSSRIGTVTVQLQKLTNSVTGYYSTISEQTVTLGGYSGTPAIANGSFAFAGVPNDGSTYRINVLGHNYSVSYLNENSASDNTAVDSNPVDNNAVIHAHLAFTPVTFQLWYKVDASAIGDGYRPVNAEVLVMYDEDIINSDLPRNWPLISQMAGNVGDTVAVGTPDSYPVWVSHPAGHLYDYAIKLDLTGTELYYVEYDGTAHYQSSGGYNTQSQLLTATLKPKAFTVTYELRRAGSVAGATVIDGDTAQGEFLWSYGMPSLPEAVPTGASGVSFGGWWTKDGSGGDWGTKLTAIEADAHANVTVYARWNYTVTWDPANGGAMTSASVLEGTMPTAPADPTKAADSHYSYTFTGWSPAITPVSGNMTYTAQYSSTVNTYTVTWKNDDGTPLDTDTVAYGAMPDYTGAVPIKASTAQYDYTFNGWTPALATVTGDVTYTASFKENLRYYTVTWNNHDDSLLDLDTNVAYGATPVYDGATPVKAGNAQYSYTFSGWTPAVAAVTGNAVYKAKFQEHTNTYTVIWKNWNGDVLETDNNVSYGDMPSYDGAEPSHDETAQYLYHFYAWDKTIEAVTGDVVYTAQFVTTTKTYTVIWKNDDGSVLETDTGVPYGSTPKYDGATPTKAADVQYTYTFDDWTPTVSTTTGGMTYTATYTQTLNSYTVVYTDGVGGTAFADQSFTVDYGMPTPDFVGTPTRPGYTFDGWNPAVNATVNGDATYTAEWTAIPVVPSESDAGTAKLNKVDADDPSCRLKNVVFALYKADGSLIGSYTTDANGQISVSELEPGAYYWQETRPAEGYILDSTTHSITVLAGQTATITVSNKHSTVPSVFSNEHYAYIVGYDGGIVRPEANITRAEVATIFFRLLNADTRARYFTKENSFSDVENGMWFNTAVSTMAAMGIVNGYPDGDFHPNDYITRAEFAAIAARFDSNGNAGGVSFTDIDGHWAQREICVAENNGWILGYENGEFRPNCNITRAEAMATVNRVLQRIPESKTDLLDAMVNWADNADPAKWYYLTVQEATNSHNYARKNNGYEYWTAITEGPDWAALEQ